METSPTDVPKKVHRGEQGKQIMLTNGRG